MTGISTVTGRHVFHCFSLRYLKFNVDLTAWLSICLQRSVGLYIRHSLYVPLCMHSRVPSLIRPFAYSFLRSFNVNLLGAADREPVGRGLASSTLFSSGKSTLLRFPQSK